MCEKDYEENVDFMKEIYQVDKNPRHKLTF